MAIPIVMDGAPCINMSIKLHGELMQGCHVVEVSFHAGVTAVRVKIVEMKREELNLEFSDRNSLCLITLTHPHNISTPVFLYCPLILLFYSTIVTLKPNGEGTQPTQNHEIICASALGQTQSSKPDRSSDNQSRVWLMSGLQILPTQTPRRQETTPSRQFYSASHRRRCFVFAHPGVEL